MEHVLHAKVPLNRIWRLHVLRNVAARTCSRFVCGHGWAALRVRSNAASLEEISDLVAVRSATNVDGRGQLRRQRKEPDVVEQDIVCHAEARADGGVATGAGRVGNTDARRPVVLGIMRLTELENAGNARHLVERLRTHRIWHRRVFVTDAEVHSKIRPHAPCILRIVVAGNLVAVVDDVAQRALRKIGLLVEQVAGKRYPLVIATGSLGERLRCDVLAKFGSEFEGM